MSDGKTALIVGASRGLGLGLVQEFRRRRWDVTGTVRDPADGAALEAAGATVERLDVTDEAQAEALVQAMGGRTLDLLFLNAGVMGPPDLRQAETGAIDAVMQANAFGPARLALKLLDRVKRDTGVVAFMSTGMGSIADNTSGGYEVYRASKAAQNMLARSLWVKQAKPRGVTVLSVNPGWVKTDMGGAGASIDVDTSVRGIADQVEQRAGSGEHAFVGWNGDILEW